MLVRKKKKGFLHVVECTVRSILVLELKIAAAAAHSYSSY